MTITAAADPRVRVDRGRAQLVSSGRTATLHPLWLRNRSQETGQIEPVSRQRLFTPKDISLDLLVSSCEIVARTLVVSFTDGHTARLDLAGIEHALGWAADDEEPPAPEPWTTAPDPFPSIDWADIGWSFDPADPDAMLASLDPFFRHGWVVFRNTPIEEGTVRRICDRLGYISGTNFGWVFDVRTEASPTDLAYTSLALLAHTDQPYRRPTPGIQLLHCLRNEAPGGLSTLVDGLAAAEGLAVADPAAHRACCETELEFRYDTGTDTAVNRGPLLDYDRQGRFRQIRLNTKLDAPIPPADGNLDAFYRGRLRLIEWLDDPAHRVTFPLQPGDVLFMDNMRVLHGRTSFDAQRGVRHLQGAYIDHDGPDTLYRLAVRRRRSQDLAPDLHHDDEGQ